MVCIAKKSEILNITKSINHIMMNDATETKMKTKYLINKSVFEAAFYERTSCLKINKLGKWPQRAFRKKYILTASILTQLFPSPCNKRRRKRRVGISQILPCSLYMYCGFLICRLMSRSTLVHFLFFRNTKSYVD